MRIEVITEGIALIFIGICAVCDIRRKEIPLPLILAGMTAAFGAGVWQMKAEGLTAAEAGMSLLPGMFFLLTGFCTGEKVGYGDGLILLAVGLLLGFYRCFLALCAALVFSAMVSLLLMVFHRADRHSRIPFVPFLGFGMGVVIFAW